MDPSFRSVMIGLFALIIVFSLREYSWALLAVILVASAAL